MYTSNPTILFFLEGKTVPSSRFRVGQYLELLEQDGVQCKELYTFPDKYHLYPSWLRGNPLRYLFSVLSLMLQILVRILQIIRYSRDADVIVLQRDLLFRVPSDFLECFLFWWVSGHQVRIILDVDDAIWCGKHGIPSAEMRNKVLSIAKRSDIVIAGNEYLADVFRESGQVEVVPTVLNHEIYLKRLKPKDFLNPIICWTGQRSNYPYLEILKPVFERLAEDFEFRVRIIAESGAGKPFEAVGYEMQICEWSPESEVRLLLDSDIGVMPLIDSEWERGKCGFKLLQYMAAGKAAVASPVGVNPEIAGSGEFALLAESTDDWLQVLAQLLGQVEYREELGARAQMQVRDRYSRDKWYPRVKAFLLGD